MSQFGRDSRKPRSKRVPRIASTTAAIRSALALSAAVLALSGTGVAYAGTCVTDAGAATPTVRIAAEAAPPSKFASYTPSTPFRWGNSREYDSAGEIDRKAYGGPFGGNQTPAGRTERPVCAPDTVTQL